MQKVISFQGHSAMRERGVQAIGKPVFFHDPQESKIMHLKKKLLIGIGILSFLSDRSWVVLEMACPIGTGYTARYICSSVFISHRGPSVTYREDVAPINPLLRSSM